MDSITHTLTALALSQTGLNRKTRFATLGLVIGANLPDVDWVTRLAGSATALKYHRGITHSLFGTALLAALLAGIIFYAGRRAAPRKNAPPLDAFWLLVLCWIATLSHLLLDFTNSYGVRPFLPFSGRWYAWDIMPLIDPLLLSLLILGLGMPVIFRLISEEVGAGKPGYRRGAIFSLCALAVVWGVRDLAHRRVLRQLDSHTYELEEPLRVGAFPAPANPLQWTGVVETETAFHVLSASALESDVDAERTEVYRKPQPSAALTAAAKTRTGEIFLDFARFPWAQVSETVDGYDAELRDLRFLSLASGRQGFLAEIDLDKELRVRSQSFSFSGDSR